MTNQSNFKLSSDYYEEKPMELIPENQYSYDIENPYEKFMKLILNGHLMQLLQLFKRSGGNRIPHFASLT